MTPFAAANPRSPAPAWNSWTRCPIPPRRTARERRDWRKPGCSAPTPTGSSANGSRPLHWEYLACRSGRVPAVVTAAWDPMTMRVLARETGWTKMGEIVSPATPAFLPRGGLPDRPETDTPRSRGLDLVPGKPLTARVFVNRLWRQFFGTGLSAQVEDPEPRANGRPTRSCWTGWRPSFATADGT